MRGENPMAGKNSGKFAPGEKVNKHRFSDKFALAVTFHRNKSGIPFLVAFGNGGFEFCFSGNRRGKRNGIFIKLGICGNNAACKVDRSGSSNFYEFLPCFGGNVFGPYVIAHAYRNVCSVVVCWSVCWCGFGVDMQCLF